MAKYIDIDISIKKTIKIETDDLNTALKKAEEILPELEMSSDWLNSRNVSIKENPIISKSSNYIASLLKDNFSTDTLETILDAFVKDELKDYIKEEILNILKNKYQIDIENIKI